MHAKHTTMDCLYEGCVGHDWSGALHPLQPRGCGGGLGAWSLLFGSHPPQHLALGAACAPLSLCGCTGNASQSTGGAAAVWHCKAMQLQLHLSFAKATTALDASHGDPMVYGIWCVGACHNKQHRAAVLVGCTNCCPLWYGGCAPES